MTYRPPEESLTCGIEQILEGIESLRSAIQKRQDNEVDPWTDKHLEELCEIELDLVSIRAKLAKLKKDTW